MIILLINMDTTFVQKGNILIAPVLYPAPLMVTGIMNDFIYYNPTLVNEFTTDFKCLNAFLSPVPLTEYWHNRFGVFKNGFGSFEYDICPYGKKEKVLSFSSDYLFIRDLSGKSRHEDDINTLWNKDIQKEFYVHDFQNLYRSLTLKDLEIMPL